MSFIRKIDKLQQWLVAKIRNINVYIETNDDRPQVRENQIRATRIYLVLLIFSICILSTYTALSRQTQTVVIKNPSQTEYEHLEALYPNTISCPCLHTIISYETFVTISVTFHQVCSSYFVTDTWLDYLTINNPSDMFYPLDIRSSISSQFRLLQILCQQSQESVSDGLTLFMESKLITPTLLSHSTFKAQVDLLVNNSLMNLLAEQQRTTTLISAINEQNQLPTALGTNFIYIAAEYNRQSLYFVQ